MMNGYQLAEITMDTMEKFVEFAKVNPIGTKFTAKDANMNGSALSALVYRGVIVETGEKHETWVKVDNDTMKRQWVKVYKLVNDWTYVKGIYCQYKDKDFQNEISYKNDQINALADKIKSLTAEIERLNRFRG